MQSHLQTPGGNPMTLDGVVPQTATRLISLDGVGMRWGKREVLEGVNITVNKGDFWAITGPNGGGKTTLLRIMLKLLLPSTGSVDYYSDGLRTERLPIGYLPQKTAIDSHFPITVSQVVASGLLSADTARAERKIRIDQTLAQIELEGHRDSPIGELSGGQLQRALLGRALISKPQILVLDEPLSYIDKRFENHIYDLISALHPDTTIILVSHEMSRIATMANRHLIVNRTVTFCNSSHHYFTSGCC